MLGSKIRRNVFQHQPSVTSSDSTTQSLGRKSVYSRKSVGSRRSLASNSPTENLREEGKWFKTREWLIIIVEVFLTFTVYQVRERNLKVEELRRIGRTRRQNEIEMLYWEGWSAFGAMFTACVGDSYIGHHTLALISVAVHFFVVCIVLMEEVIKGNQKGNPYAAIVFNIVLASIIIIKSTDFTRLVFGLEGMTNRRKVTIMHFIFLITLVSEKTAYGGLVVNFFSPFYGEQGVRLSFAASGIGLFIFVYVIVPVERRKEHFGLGCKVVHCFLLGSYYKLFRVKRRMRKAWLYNTDNRVDKSTIANTRELLILYILLLPTIGFLLAIGQRPELYFRILFERVKDDNAFLETFGTAVSCNMMALFSAVVSYFSLWPIMNYFGMRNRTMVKFLLGHVVTCLGLFCCAGVMMSLETFEFDPASGFVRVFNTREHDVRVVPQNRQFSTFSYTVKPGKGVMVSYPCHLDTLFALTFHFNQTSTNFTLFLSVYPDTVTGFMILDPPDVTRIRGRLPVREGPPGTNEHEVGPRIYLFNTAKTLQNASLKIKKTNAKATIKDIIISAGHMTVFQLAEGSYEFSVPRADLKKIFELEHGGVYGVLLYADTSSRNMALDTVVGGNTASIWPSLIYYFIRGAAVAIGLVTLRYMTFTAAPPGLLSMSLAYIYALQYLTYWVGFIGFKTWHFFVTSTTTITYGFTVTFCLFVCMFVLIKYRDVYNS